MDTKKGRSSLPMKATRLKKDAYSRLQGLLLQKERKGLQLRIKKRQCLKIITVNY
jgi:hypothetical protein